MVTVASIVRAQRKRVTRPMRPVRRQCPSIPHGSCLRTTTIQTHSLYLSNDPVPWRLQLPALEMSKQMHTSIEILAPPHQRYPNFVWLRHRDFTWLQATLLSLALPQSTHARNMCSARLLATPPRFQSMLTITSHLWHSVMRLFLSSSISCKHLAICNIAQPLACIFLSTLPISLAHAGSSALQHPDGWGISISSNPLPKLPSHCPNPYWTASTKAEGLRVLADMGSIPATMILSTQDVWQWHQACINPGPGTTLCWPDTLELYARLDTVWQRARRIICMGGIATDPAHDRAILLPGTYRYADLLMHFPDRAEIICFVAFARDSDLVSAIDCLSFQPERR